MLLVSVVLSVLLTVYNPPGQKILALAVSSSHVFTVFFAGVVWLMADVIRQAHTQYGRAFLLAETDNQDFTHFLAGPMATMILGGRPSASRKAATAALAALIAQENGDSVVMLEKAPMMPVTVPRRPRRGPRVTTVSVASCIIFRWVEKSTPFSRSGAMSMRSAIFSTILGIL